jgi:hypothetical protein
MQVHPSDCEVCKKLRRLTRARLRLESPRTLTVQTWCRICGLAAYLEVLTDYEEALTHFYGLDDQPMVHKHMHAEVGGWGVHWRLDEVLASIFVQHEPIWPKPPWYEHSHAEDEVVKVFSDPKAAMIASRADVDVEVRMLQSLINRHPRTREQLAGMAHMASGKLPLQEVWDTKELSERFEVLGFKNPFAIVRDRTTGQRGSVLFQHSPRYYFGFDPHRVI